MWTELLNPKAMIAYKGVVDSYLSPHFIRSQNLNDKDIEKLVKLHVRRLTIFDRMKKMSSSKSLKRFVPVIEKLEFEMQKVWKFKVDRNYHTWWYQVPHCNCPKGGNFLLFGKSKRLISTDCPVHS